MFVYKHVITDTREENVANSDEQKTLPQYETIEPLPDYPPPPIPPQQYSVPVTHHTPPTDLIRPRLKAYSSRPMRIELMSTTRPSRHNEDGEGDYSDTGSEDRKCTPQEWIPKWRVDSFKESTFTASGTYDQGAATTKPTMTHNVQASTTFGSLELSATHKTDNQHSKIALSYDITSQEKFPTTSQGQPHTTSQGTTASQETATSQGKSPTKSEGTTASQGQSPTKSQGQSHTKSQVTIASKGKSLVTFDSTSSVNMKKSRSIDSNGYCRWEDWNLPLPTGPASSSHDASSDNEYVNEGLGPPPPSNKTQPNAQTTTEESIDIAPDTETTTVDPTQTEQRKNSSNSDNDDYYVNAGLGPIPTKKENKSAAAATQEKYTNDNCDDDGYFIMESLQQNRLLATTQERPPSSEEGVLLLQSEEQPRTYMYNTLFPKRHSDSSNMRSYWGRSFSIENFSSSTTSAHSRREASFSQSRYDSRTQSKYSLGQLKHYPSAFSVQHSYSRPTITSSSSLAAGPTTNPDQHKYEYIDVPRRRREAHYLQSVSEWIGNGAMRAESVVTETMDPVGGTLV